MAGRKGANSEGPRFLAALGSSGPLTYPLPGQLPEFRVIMQNFEVRILPGPPYSSSPLPPLSERLPETDRLPLSQGPGTGSTATRPTVLKFAICKQMPKCYTRPMWEHLQRGRFLRLLLFAPLVFFLLSALAVRGQSLPASVTDLDGHVRDPFHDATGKIVVLLFVRTDCPISNRYAPTIQGMSRRYGNRAVFYLVYPIKSETADQIRKHKQEYDYHLPILRDPDYALVKRAQVQVTPEAAVFSPTGSLLYHGRIDDWYVDFGRARPSPTSHDLSGALDAAVADKPVPSAAAPAVGCFLPGLP
jgi:thiol-disulfide isomerase/thioredoxin